MNRQYDVIVVGAGHAGCEAALAAARLGCRTLLLSINLDTAGHMPCSPSIGGIGKGHLVKEIDALGGEMGKIADASAIQIRRLNTRKGMAVRGTRTQNDKVKHRSLIKHSLERQKNLETKQSLVTALLVEDGRVKGVEDDLGVLFLAECVVLCGGTFYHGLIYVGTHRIPAGRAGEFSSDQLPAQLEKLGLQPGRMKTGTPARLNRRSIDFSKFEEQVGAAEYVPFSLFTDKKEIPQVKCYFGRTQVKTHEIIKQHVHLSPLYNGSITGISARYCPSIEDKIIKFPHKEYHQIILEPEGLETEEIYASGTGNSLPYEIQERLIRSIAGLEECEIMRPAYAIEYDFFQPTQLQATLESKKVQGLYLAGQINGTSGYEEAAAQGIWAGINAALKVQKRPPFLLDRSQAYLGVMIDDLVVKGVKDPYRMFTSRAEYRLLLREDNADLRLLEIGYQLGLHSRDTYRELCERKKALQDELQRLKSTRIFPGPEVDAVLEKASSKPLQEPVSAYKLLKRPELKYGHIQCIVPPPGPVEERVREQVEIECKYEGYLQRQESEVNKFKDLENIRIPDDFSYANVSGLSNEIRQALSRVRPVSLGQASRIAGVTPAAISLLRVYLRKFSFENSGN